MIALPKALPSLLLAAAVALGCASEPAEETGEMTETAAVDTDAIRAELEAGNDAWESAAMAGDATALAALYTDDASLLAPDMPRAVGQAEILSTFQAMLDAVTFESMEITTDEVTVSESGDLAYVVGSYTDSGTLADGTPFTESGKFVSIHRNVGGEWKITVDAWNASPPEAAAPAETAETAEDTTT